MAEKAVQCLKILQRCMEYYSAAGSMFGYRQFRVSVGWVGGVGGVVGSDALPSSSPSLIWL